MEATDDDGITIKGLASSTSGGTTGFNFGGYFEAKGFYGTGVKGIVWGSLGTGIEGIADHGIGGHFINKPLTLKGKNITIM